MNPHLRRSRLIRLFLLRWHRWCGAIAALFVVLISLSGVLINHAHTLGWDHQPVRSPWLLSVYGVEPEVPRFGYNVVRHNVDSAWLVRVSGQLYWNLQLLGECGDSFAGAVAVEDSVAALCGKGLYLLTSDGELVERLSGQPESMQRLGISAGKLIAQSHEQYWEIDMEEGRWIDISPPQLIDWVVAQTLPDSLSGQLSALATPKDITWERLLLDLHSGRLLGGVGVLMIDFLGVIMMFLACSGLWAWLTRHKHK